MRDRVAHNLAASWVAEGKRSGGLANPSAFRALRELTRSDNQGPRAWLRSNLLPQTIIHTRAEWTEAQHIRLGRQWIKTPSARRKLIKARIAPATLPFWAFTKWVRQRAFGAVEALLLGREPRQPRHDLFDAPPVERFVFPPPETLSREHDLFEALELKSQVTQLMMTCSPRELALLEYHKAGLSRAEAAARMKIKRGTVDVMWHHIREKARKAVGL